MARPKFSVAILHRPGFPDRDENLATMLTELASPILKVFDRERGLGEDFHRFKVTLFLEQWEWSLSTEAEHHIFLTDDLYLAPHFLEIIEAMVAVRPVCPIGLLSNHPETATLFDDGTRGYWTNSWLVGPAYVLPHDFLLDFVQWYGALPNSSYERGHAQHYNDDSAINEFVSVSGRKTWHPIPTPIEHRGDLPSTVGHGDKYSRERVSWRQAQKCLVKTDGSLHWTRQVFEPHPANALVLCHEMVFPSFWEGNHPFLPLPE
jgi:hypothetical protein